MGGREVDQAGYAQAQRLHPQRMSQAHRNPTEGLQDLIRNNNSKLKVTSLSAALNIAITGAN